MTFQGLLKDLKLRDMSTLIDITWATKIQQKIWDSVEECQDSAKQKVLMEII